MKEEQGQRVAESPSRWRHYGADLRPRVGDIVRWQGDKKVSTRGEVVDLDRQVDPIIHWGGAREGAVCNVFASCVEVLVDYVVWVSGPGEGADGWLLLHHMTDRRICGSRGEMLARAAEAKERLGDHGYRYDVKEIGTGTVQVDLPSSVVAKILYLLGGDDGRSDQPTKGVATRSAPHPSLRSKDGAPGVVEITFGKRSEAGKPGSVHRADAIELGMKGLGYSREMATAMVDLSIITELAAFERHHAEQGAMHPKEAERHRTVKAALQVAEKQLTLIRETLGATAKESALQAVTRVVSELGEARARFLDHQRGT
jgi:hypothetical protein